MVKISINHALNTIYQEYPDNAILLDLLRLIANYSRTQLDKGYDLSTINNNTLCVKYETFGVWNNVECLDELVLSSQPFEERVLALANLDFPDDYWRIFKYMVFHDAIVPTLIDTQLNQLREDRREKSPETITCDEQKIWLWDEKSAQAMVILNRKNKAKYRSFYQYISSAFRILTSLPRVFIYYYHYKKSAYKTKISLQGRVCIAIHPPYQANELPLLKELSIDSVLVRFYAHEKESDWCYSVDYVKRLYEQGFNVAIALVQDRQSVIQIKKWEHLLEIVIPPLHDKIMWVEVGHAVNRVKWGIWTTKEYHNLFKSIQQYQQQYPSLKLIAPAVIDFEWPRLIDFMKGIKRSSVYALSQHLYVDRRGAPENYQGKFSTLEKTIMAKAIARTLLQKTSNVIISEVNWPIKHAGIWSPIGSPYTAPEWFLEQPGVTEDDYANYLIRYLTITLCSGFIEQVVWWRLSAKGYGLVDDQDGFRKRPAYFALKQFMQWLGNAEFVRYRQTNQAQYIFEFKNKHNRIILAWQKKGFSDYPIVDKIESIMDRDGNVFEENKQIVTVSERPLYILLSAHENVSLD